MMWFPRVPNEAYADMVEYLRWEENLGRKYLNAAAV